jgi:hypothetical protein
MPLLSATYISTSPRFLFLLLHFSAIEEPSYEQSAFIRRNIVYRV